MKKYLFITLAIILFFPSYGFAQTTESFSGGGASVAGNSLSGGLGTNKYPDALIISAHVNGSTETLISTSTPFTILQYSIISFSNQDSLTCNGVELIDSNFVDFWLARSVDVGSYWSYNLASDIHCSGNLVFENLTDESYAIIQYVPYDTRLKSMPLSDTHFIQIAGFFIFFSSMVLILWIFKKRI